ncbi:MAG: 2-oxoacid:acceptor oxidoreductase family protein [Candidatus Omnitrophota bacterium]|nr:2-oxoacid:acceptor oxidoreductase family protein [Candidatus Omnitrophota bacterium]
MKIDILLSGFGGQGLISLGKILANTALRENKHTTYIPSYGPEVRGGTAYCFVKISDTPITSPLVGKSDIAIILNQLSLDRFEKVFKKGSVLILNSDLSSRKPLRKDTQLVYLPLNKMALECGNAKVIGVLALGVLIRLKPKLLKKETIEQILKETFSDKVILEQNIKALHKGEEIGKS